MATITTKSSRATVYQDYFPDFSAAAALRVLIYLAVGILASEAALRIFDPCYARTAVSSLHGVRAILQQVLEDPEPKILCFGDSSFVGGGIYRHDQTVAGLLASELDGPHVYNLALPGGDSVTSGALLDQLRERKVRNVDRVVIETLAGKWLEISPAEARLQRGVLESGKELRRLIPDIDFGKFGIDFEPMSRADRVEVCAEWQLGRVSRLYRHRDYFRTEVIGNYPAIWFIGKAVPRSLMARLNPKKARGTNRLAARMDDFNYAPDEAEPQPHLTATFSGKDERDSLLQAVEIAKSISHNPPVILAFPMFHELQGLDDADRQTFFTALQALEAELKEIATKTGSELMMVKSEEMQDPADWTATPSHFNAAGARRIWQMVRPRFCEWYRCKSEP